jgi:hypothetical protein
MKWKTNTVRTVPKSYQKIVETNAKLIPPDRGGSRGEHPAPPPQKKK